MCVRGAVWWCGGGVAPAMDDAVVVVGATRVARAAAAAGHSLRPRRRQGQANHHRSLPSVSAWVYELFPGQRVCDVRVTLLHVPVPAEHAPDWHLYSLLSAGLLRRAASVLQHVQSLSHQPLSGVF